MRAIPDFAGLTALLDAPLSDAARRRGRYVVGSLAAVGSAAILLAAGGSAEAKGLGPNAQRPPSPVAVVPSATDYVIQAGDTLTSIAARFGTTVQAVATQNHVMNVHRIRAGDRLVIAGRPVAPSAAAPATAGAPVAPSATSGRSRAAALAALRRIPLGTSPGGALPPGLQSRPDRKALQGAFRSAAHDFNVPAELLQSMDWHESGWQGGVVSSTGALGIGQLMPDTVTFVNQSLLPRPLDPRKPADNVRMSAAFLRYLLDQVHGDYRTALAAYYQGLRSVNENGPYDETLDYVQMVLAVQKAYF